MIGSCLQLELTFLCSIAITENESSSALIDRIVRKSGLDEKASQGVKEGRDGGLLQYEFEGGRWTLQDGQSAVSFVSRY